jgi:Cu/Ag efflux protein CusF
MRIVRIIVAGATAMNVLMTAALAQQPMTGVITKIDRIHGTIAIQQTQSGTVGASAGGATAEYKVQDRPLLDSVHAGDKVTFSAAESSGVKTITNLKKQ